MAARYEDPPQRKEWFCRTIMFEVREEQELQQQRDGMNIQKTIEALDSILKNSGDKEKLSLLLLLKNRQNKLEDEYKKGLLSIEEKEYMQAGIYNSLMELKDDLEKENWELANMYATIEAYEEYIEEFPQGKFVSNAKKQIDRLQHIRLTHQSRKIDEKLKNPALTHEAVLRIEAEPEHLDSIQEVTYNLHRSFKNPNVKRVNRKDNFSLKILLWGEFDMSATIVFEDGESIVLDHELTLA